MSLEAQDELRQFLKVVRPDWSRPEKRGTARACPLPPVTRVIQKLQVIGVNDTAELLDRVFKNTINEELSAAGCTRFSRDTLQAIRSQASFFQSLEHLKEPSYRQIGLFAPVPQMLTGRNLRNQVLKSSNCNSGSLLPSTGRVPDMNSPQSRAGSAQRRPHTVSGAPSTRTDESFNEVSATSSSPRPRTSMVIGTSGIATPHTISSIGYDQFDQYDGSSSFYTVLPRLRGIPEGGPRRSRPSTSTSAPQLISSVVSESDVAASSGYAARRRDSVTSSTWGGSTAGLLRAAAGHEPAKTNMSEEEQLQLDVERWNRDAERQSVKREPQWSSFLHGELFEYGEAMMLEQETIEAKRKLQRQMRHEGEISPMRAHVAHKIRTRLREEKVTDAQVNMDVQQTCLSIRKNIEAMMKSRRLLSSLNTEAKTVVEPPKEGKRMVGLSVDLWKRKNKLINAGRDEFMEPSREESPSPAEDSP
mmetsp:Transcript_120694/g.225518  ORF Transcript_120694/g.225518 Transcript_120694/m.225518 type:complete len:474 (-) Transcript_120694:120-1541(-)